MKHKALHMKAVDGEKGIYRRGTKYLAKASVGGDEQYAGTHDTLAAAKRARALKIAEMIREQERGRPKRYDTETTFATYAEEFLTRRGTATNSQAFAPSTLRAIETHIHKHLVLAFGELRIGKITPSRVETLFEEIATDASRKYRRRKYRRNVFQTLCLIFDDAFRKRVIPYDPTEHLPLPKVPRTRIKVPPPELVHRVIDEMKSPWKDAALLAASSGMREGEVLALEWADIDVARRCIRVTKARDQAGGQTTPKTDESVREVVVTEGTLAALFEYRDRTRAERAAARTAAEATLHEELARRSYVREKPAKKPKNAPPRPRRVRGESVRVYKARRLLANLSSPHWDIYMFPAAIMPLKSCRARAEGKQRNRVGPDAAPTKKTRPARMPVLEPRNLLRELHRAASVFGIKLRFHDLRHVWASVVLQLGGDSALKFVSNNLGHTTSSFTLDTYVHFLPDRAGTFLAPIDAIFHGRESHTAPHSAGAERRGSRENTGEHGVLDPGGSDHS
jgi:integrase